MKKRIICVILSLAAVFSLIGFHATEAWYSGGEVKSQILKSGNLDFKAAGDLTLKDETVLVLPGEELELKEAIVITNYSTIETELRIRVECTYDTGNGVMSQPVNWIEFVNAEESNWVVEDGFLYYCPKGINNPDRHIPPSEITEEQTTVVETTTVIEETTGEEETTTEEVEVIEDEVTETTTEATTVRVYAENEILLAGKIRISGDVPIELQGKKMNIVFTIEAKQADFLYWENFDEVKK